MKEALDLGMFEKRVICFEIAQQQLLKKVKHFNVTLLQWRWRLIIIIISTYTFFSLVFSVSKNVIPQRIVNDQV